MVNLKLVTVPLQGALLANYLELMELNADHKERHVSMKMASKYKYKYVSPTISSSKKSSNNPTQFC